MVRSGSTKKVPDTHWVGRLRRARQFLRIAQDSLVFVKPGDDGGPIMSIMILSAVAYADALTVAVSEVVNHGDHAKVTKVLRDALGNELPKAQETNLKQMLSQKDDVQYGARFEPLLDAEQMMQRARSFADWVENELARRFPKEVSQAAGAETEDHDI